VNSPRWNLGFLKIRDPNTVDYLPLLQRELLEVVRKYVAIEDEHIKVHVEKEGEYEVLELNITLPDEKRLSSL